MLIDELTASLDRVLFELRNFESKRLMTETVRRRLMRNALPSEYVIEFNQLLMVFERDFQSTGFELERQAFRAVMENIRFDLNEAKRKRAA
ncbi:MAG: hypothetical protein JXR73_06845 [Candidatus Omnitrophica bacterium]|nr:hypothetical protein [Candidatus Omnitrophota bacterium]